MVLTDVQMRPMDGRALLRNLRARFHELPVLVMTAYGTVKSAVQALKEGVTNYLIKPLDYDELVIVLEKALRDHDLSHEGKHIDLGFLMGHVENPMGAKFGWIYEIADFCGGISSNSFGRWGILNTSAIRFGYFCVTFCASAKALRT